MVGVDAGVILLPCHTREPEFHYGGALLSVVVFTTFLWGPWCSFPEPPSQVEKPCFAVPHVA